MAEFNALPDISVIRLNPMERALGRMVKLTTATVPGGEAQVDLARDCFHAQFLTAPTLLEEVPAARNVNHAVLNWWRGTSQSEESRHYTVANLPASIAATTVLYSALTDEKTVREALKKQEEAAQADREAQKQEAMAQGFRAARMDSQAQQAAAAATAARQAARAAAEVSGQMLEKAQKNALTHAAVINAARKAEQAAKEMAEATAGWGFGPGSDVLTNAQAALDFVRRNDQRLQQIAKLAGRFRGIALQTRNGRVATGPIPNEGALVQDLFRVFVSELALLRPDAPTQLRAETIARWAEGGLLGLKPGADAEEKGPFVGAVDVSGSMSGDRETMAKGIALGVAQVARSEDRRYTLFTFGSDTDPVFAVDSHEPWVRHMEWAGKSRGGGTSFDRALRETIARLRALGEAGRHADALFISDGEAAVSPQVAEAWKAFTQEMGARLMYVPVAAGYRSIELLADRVIQIGELDIQHLNDADRLAADIAGWMRP